MTDLSVEVNFDGIVGPTHNYAGLAWGNVASASHALEVSYPKRAALQGLAKMSCIRRFGIGQAVLPPHQRPHLELLKEAGFSGNDEKIIQQAYQEQPKLLAQAYSASAMWAANAATVSASADTKDGRLHLTVANLASNMHRKIEAEQTEDILRKIFANEERFTVHSALDDSLGDEGAANHTRLCASQGGRGIELFIFGQLQNEDEQRVTKFPARQHEAASRAIAKSHGLDKQAVVFAQQNPEVIDEGVFHNDVISVGNENVLLVHERAYVDQPRVLDELREKYEKATGGHLYIIEVGEEVLSVTDAVATYFFNSQIVTQPGGGLGGSGMVLIMPDECQQHQGVQSLCESILSGDNPIGSVCYINVRESMRNGGGPACLRLRVPLTEPEQCAIHGGVILTNALYEKLVNWVEKHYRDELRAEDLQDPNLMRESNDALDELTALLRLGSVYPFQK